MHSVAYMFTKDFAWSSLSLASEPVEINAAKRHNVWIFLMTNLLLGDDTYHSDQQHQQIASSDGPASQGINFSQLFQCAGILIRGLLVENVFMLFANDHNNDIKHNKKTESQRHFLA